MRFPGPILHCHIDGTRTDGILFPTSKTNCRREFISLAAVLPDESGLTVLAGKPQEKGAPRL